MLVGEVGKPHGLAGEVYVVPISDDPRRFGPGALLETEDGSPLTVHATRAHGDRLLVRFDGVTSRDDAEQLRGPLYAASETRRDLGNDEYWHHDLAGLEVVTADGTQVGRIATVVRGAAQDLLSVETDGGERLVPLVKEIVTDVDLARGRVTVDPPEGLL